MKTRPLLLLPLGIIACACVCGGGEILSAQEPAPSSQAAQTAQPAQPLQKKTTAGQSQNAPILVAGTEFMILDPVPVKPKEAGGKNRLPLSLVVLAWVVAMVLWQVYFNRKAQ